MEFLFGSILSTKGTDDLLALNPYVRPDTLNLALRLVCISMLRANRVGQANRCLGSAVSLLELLDKALMLPAGPERLSKADTLVPKLIQASESLAAGLASKRSYMPHDAGGQQTKESIGFDPRFLLFEFVWNILLRQKQVQIVQNFRATLAEGKSKVKQMIMGAGKTTVVAPLLALMLADGNSLVISAVPKALLEMSRKVSIVHAYVLCVFISA